MDKISSFWAKEERKLHFSHAQRHSYTITFRICVRRAERRKREREAHFVMSSSALASSSSVFVFDYGATKTNGNRGKRIQRERILEKKRSIRTREAAEEESRRRFRRRKRKRKRQKRCENNGEKTSDGENGAKISTSRLRTLRRNGKTGSQSRLAKTSSLIR